ncbi:tetratricopeptide repeat protein [Acetobacter nitrogenifigens]|uniref:tetratricopeptide repeat protein n=1 Tax=Acetobacter nitrogenifigens TaxID=285268 RepID=UPI001378617B|nr:tetratricopeptide repeat protein [Acetobacter nitrogenifigens]
MRIRLSLALSIATACGWSLTADAASGSGAASAGEHKKVHPAAAPASTSPTHVEAGGLPAGWRQNLVTPAADGAAAPATVQAPATLPDNASRPGAPSPANPDAGAASGATTEKTSPAVTKIFLPLGDKTGVAGFWSRKTFVIVADHAVAMDAAALRDSGPFSALSVHLLGDSAIITVPASVQGSLSLSKAPGGWVLAAEDVSGRPRQAPSITPEQKDGGVLYPMPKAGRVIALADPSSGARLQIGTSAEEVSGGTTFRRHVGYEIWPAAQGVVFAVESDRINVRSGAGGPFVDAVGQNSAPVVNASSSSLADDDVDWSWLGLRPLTPAALREDFRRRWTQAALASPEGRGEPRLAAARAAFAMGDAKTARSIVDTAVKDEPALAGRPGVMLLAAAAALLSGDTQAAGALEQPDPRESGSFWRGLYLARAGGDRARAAALLAVGYPRLKTYPQPLREQLQPEAATFIAQNGSDGDLGALGELPSDPAFDPARAFLLLRRGDRQGALAAFERLAARRDDRQAELGREQSIGLKLQLQRISPAEAAKAYSGLLLQARLVGRELDVRKAQIAALMQAGSWREALHAIDDMESVFPDQRSPDSSQVEAILDNLTRASDHGANTGTNDVIDSVALVESHIDQIPDTVVKGRILAGLATQLQTIGLPGQAASALEKALPLAADDALRAEWGARLAEADVAAKRLGQARRALDETADTGAPADVVSRRRVIAAGLLAQEGGKDEALQMLAQDESDAALDLRGRLLEEQRKWADATLVVGRLATRRLPEKGDLSNVQQDLAIRLASDAARVNDWATLDRLRDWVGGRRMTAERQRVFTLLVTSPEEDLRLRSGQR